MDFVQVKQIFGIRGMHLDYIGLIHSLPVDWRRRPTKAKEFGPIINPNVQAIISFKKGSKHIYNTLMTSTYKDVNNTWETPWEAMFDDIEWSSVYSLCRITTKSTAYQALQYKIITRTVATNSLLYRMGLTDSHKCTRCHEGNDTISHKFWSCPDVFSFWKDVWNFIITTRMYPDLPPVTERIIILGYQDSLVVNHIILVGKRMITQNYNLSLDTVFSIHFVFFNYNDIV